MNYGYECKGWTAAQKERLAQKFSEILLAASYVPGSTIRATIEIDESYPGVWVRKMTWMTTKCLANVIAAMDYAFDAELKSHRDGG